MIALRNLFGIGSVTLADDSGDMQQLQITERTAGQGIADRIMDKVRRVAEFGFASVPPIDSEALIARRGGERIQSMVIGTSHRPSRPRNLSPGDTCVYDVRGQKITISADGITVDGAGLNLPVTVRNVPKLRVEATQIECTGDVVANVDGTPISLAALHAAYVAHKHTGVAAGSASTGLTDHTA